MEIKRFIELGGQLFNPWPVYSEDLTGYCDDDRILRITDSLQQIITPSTSGILIRNEFDKWKPKTSEEAFYEAQEFVLKFRRLRESHWVATGITALEMNIFESFPLPLLNGHSNKKLFDLCAIAVTGFGDGGAYLDKDTNRWQTTQRIGAQYHKSNFRLVALEN